MPSRPWSELIETWFAETLDDPKSIPHRMSWWFAADDARDSALADRFGNLVETCAQGRLYRWLGDPEGRLALVLALDQLQEPVPRNAEGFCL